MVNEDIVRSVIVIVSYHLGLAELDQNHEFIYSDKIKEKNQIMQKYPLSKSTLFLEKIHKPVSK